MIAELESLIQSVDLPVDWIGLRSVKETITTRTVRDGLPESNGSTLSQGIMVEVLVKGQLGYAATNSLHPDRVRSALWDAYYQAIAASDWNLYPITVAARPKVVGQYVSPLITDFDALAPSELYAVLMQICQRLRVSDQVVQTSAATMTTETEAWFVSSNGSQVYQRFFRVGTDYAATAQEGLCVQRRSDHGWFARCYQGGLEFFVEDDLWQRVQSIGEQSIELLTAEECPTETTTLVLAPDQMLLQIHESVGHPLELDRILGDERNYAGGSFVKPEDFGHLVYGSPLMNITFDPTIAGEYASYAFDDTGVPAEREFLIRDGILQRGLGSLESQNRLGVPGVACARASTWNRPPIDRMANLNLEPGETAFADMIARIERGIYMEANRSWSIDDQRHKFQFSCEYAKLIENGQFTRTLRNPNYRGITPQFWNSLVQVGDRQSWQMYGTPSCGKGEPNQIISVGHGSPAAAFANVEVFGGGA
ncbi:TldD/PmbA family protein [Alkalinema pantanalense CENA528]|uniref:TldD/PmbA family protein n=1 Tax=Alkalinema pantanalense TaxID=1620705 RepID=UPI003D6F8DF0